MRRLALVAWLAITDSAWAQNTVPPWGGELQTPPGLVATVGGVAPDVTGNVTGVVTTPALTAKIGATVSSGHMTAAQTVSFPTIALTGTAVTMSGLVDTVSGISPNVGASCWVSSATATPLPVLLDCTVTASGTVSLRARPFGIVAINTATSMPVYVFWNW